MRREPQITLEKLLKNTDDIEELLSIVVNGHPSIEEDHFCWDALMELREMEEEEIIKLYEEIQAG